MMRKDPIATAILCLRPLEDGKGILRMCTTNWEPETRELAKFCYEVLTSKDVCVCVCLCVCVCFLEPTRYTTENLRQRFTVNLN